MATAKGHLSIVEKLIKSGAKVNERSASGYSALFIAISDDNEELVNYLLRSGADPNLVDDNKDTALSLAKRLKNPAIIQMLKKAGAK